jgi:hypothetical protein
MRRAIGASLTLPRRCDPSRAARDFASERLARQKNASKRITAVDNAMTAT